MNNSRIRITVLVENCVRQRGLLAEHGLAFWIEAGGRQILFDTGQGMVLRHNARELGFDLSAADAVVLSHGHYDHTGGLQAELDSFRRATHARSDSSSRLRGLTCQLKVKSFRCRYLGLYRTYLIGGLPDEHKYLLGMGLDKTWWQRVNRCGIRAVRGTADRALAILQCPRFRHNLLAISWFLCPWGPAPGIF